MKRDISYKNIQKIISDINIVNGSCVTENYDTQQAFTEFHGIISVNKYRMIYGLL